MSKELATQNGNGAATAIVERSFEGNELAQHTDQTSVLAQQAVATMQARYTLAKKFPRNFDAVRQNLLKDCERPGFASSALYNKPIGKGIVGLSIRFAEAAIRCMGNVYVETMLVSDTPETRITRVVVNELESNITYHKDIVVEKTVERSYLKQGQIPLGSRVNSSNKMVYIVEATDDEIMSKEANLVSKAMRTELLRLLPVDIKEECIETINRVNADEVKRDPDAARKKMIARFDEKGVTAGDISKYLNRTDLTSISPEEIQHMAMVYHTLADNEASWAELLSASPYIIGDGGEVDKKAAELQDKIKQKMEDRKKKKVPGNAPAEPSEDMVTPEQRAQIEKLVSEVYPDDTQKALVNLIGAGGWETVTESDAAQYIAQLNGELQAILDQVAELKA